MTGVGFTRQHEAAERVALRRWLRANGEPEPVEGQEPNHTERLMKQVISRGGDPHGIMREAREGVDRENEKRKMQLLAPHVCIGGGEVAIISSGWLLYERVVSRDTDIPCFTADRIAKANGLWCAERMVKAVAKRGGIVKIGADLKVIGSPFTEEEMKP